MFAFWLKPERHAREAFEAIIHQLAKCFDAPAFAAHVTLFGGEMDAAQARSVLSEIARRRAPVELEVAQIESSAKYTKTLYVQFRPSAVATALSTAVREALRTRGGYKFDPHLSLLYQHLPEHEKRDAASLVRLPFDRVEFDELVLVRVPKTIEERKDIEAWETIAGRSLERSAG